MKPPGPMQWPATTDGHFSIGNVMQLVMHVTHRVKVDQRRDERHHAKHADGQRINVVADGDPQFAEFSEHPWRTHPGNAKVTRVGNRNRLIRVLAVTSSMFTGGM